MRRSIFNKRNIIIVLVFLSIIMISNIVYKDFFIKKSSTTRTIMIYMVGSDLESNSGLASSDLKELKYRKIKNNNTNVILMAGGTTSWQNNYIDVNETSIYELEKDGFVKTDTRSKDNMGDTNNLLYFLNYVYDNYKSTKYDFIYWNHGGGVDGSEYDDFTDDHLMLEEMKNAFSNSPFQGDNKLDVISFRTCLNGTVEMANIYKNYADYFVASEEIVYITNTVSNLRFINDLSPDDDGVTFGKKQISNYEKLIKDMCEDEEDGECFDATYSIIDLSKIDSLNESINAFSNDLVSNLSNNYKDYSTIRSNMKQYAYDVPYYDMVDLYDMTEQFDKYSTNGSLVRERINDTVIYNWSSNDYSHGLSIYFPYNRGLYLNFYNDIEVSANYSNFINNFYKVKINNNNNYYSSFNNNNNSMVKEIDNTQGIVELELDQEQISNMTKAQYLVFVDTKDGFYEPIYEGNTIEIKDNKVIANISNKLLRLSDYEYLDNSIWLSTKEIESNSKYTDLKATVLLSKTNSTFFNKNIVAYLIIRIDDKHKDGYIRSIYTNLDSIDNIKYTYSPVGIKLDDYNFISTITTRYKLLEDGNYNTNWKNTTNNIINSNIYKTNEFKLVKEDFSNDYDYYVVFRIYDIYNNTYYSKPIKLK